MVEKIWFVLWGVLWAVYFMLDGFDLGLGTLLPFVSKSDMDRRIIYNTMGPFWDGNEVWLVTAGGVTFAAFPGTYAVMFSSLYSALMLILFALILRGVSFEFRSKIESPAWRSLWDACMTAGSFLPALLFGVAFANIFRGMPIDSEGISHGGFFSLLNPYGILGGLFFLFLFLTHGSLWLAVKSEGPLHDRAASAAKSLWILLLIFAVIFLIATEFSTPLYRNYLNHPVLFIIPLLAVMGLLLNRWFMGKSAWWKAWFSSSLTIVACTLFGVAGLYPDLFPSSMDPAYSMNIRNSSSSPLTLKIMLGVVLVFVPLVILYQAWAYHTFRGKVTSKDITGYENEVY